MTMKNKIIFQVGNMKDTFGTYRFRAGNRYPAERERKWIQVMDPFILLIDFWHTAAGRFQGLSQLVFLRLPWYGATPGVNPKFKLNANYQEESK